jgi:hypothetical protein
MSGAMFMSPTIIRMPAGIGIGIDIAIPGMFAMLVSCGGVVCADATEAHATSATQHLNSRCL